MTSPDLGEIGSREKEQILALPPPPAQTQQAAANPLKWEGALGPPGCPGVPGVPAGRAASGHAPWGPEVRGWNLPSALASPRVTRTELNLSRSHI